MITGMAVTLQNWGKRYSSYHNILKAIWLADWHLTAGSHRICTTVAKISWHMTLKRCGMWQDWWEPPYWSFSTVRELTQHVAIDENTGLGADRCTERIRLGFQEKSLLGERCSKGSTQPILCTILLVLRVSTGVKDKHINTDTVNKVNQHNCHVNPNYFDLFI